MPLEESPDRVLASADGALKQQTFDLGKRQIRLLFYKLQKPFRMSDKRRLPMAANGARLGYPRGPPSLHPFDCN
jgi:hypothetical protein